MLSRAREWIGAEGVRLAQSMMGLLTYSRMTLREGDSGDWLALLWTGGYYDFVLVVKSILEVCRIVMQLAENQYIYRFRAVGPGDQTDGERAVVDRIRLGKLLILFRYIIQLRTRTTLGVGRKRRARASATTASGATTATCARPSRQWTRKATSSCEGSRSHCTTARAC